MMEKAFEKWQNGRNVCWLLKDCLAENVKMCCISKSDGKVHKMDSTRNQLYYSTHGCQFEPASNSTQHNLVEIWNVGGRVGNWPSMYFWQSIDYWFSPDSDVNLENTLNCHATGDGPIFENIFSGRKMAGHLGFVSGFVQSGQSGLSHVLRKESTSTRRRSKGLFRFLKINSFFVREPFKKVWADFFR